MKEQQQITAKRVQISVVENILDMAVEQHPTFMALNAMLVTNLEAVHNEAVHDESASYSIYVGAGPRVKIIYTKTAGGAAGYTYVLPDGSFAHTSSS